MFFEYFGQQSHAISDGYAPTDIDDIVCDRLFAAEHGGETGMSGDIRRIATLEQYPTTSNAVDKRAGALRIAVTAQVIRTLRVKGNQDDVHQPLTSSMVPFCHERI